MSAFFLTCALLGGGLLVLQLILGAVGIGDVEELQGVHALHDHAGQAETSAKAISNLKFDKVVVWDSGNGHGAASGFLQNMAKTLPPMMQVLRDIAGVELPGYVGTMARDGAVGEANGASVVPASVATLPVSGERLTESG